MSPDLYKNTPPSRPVPAVDRAARMLAILEGERGPLSLSELARRLDASKGTVRDILETLRHHGLVARDEESKLYDLGGRLIGLGARARARLGVGEVARPFLQTLAESTGEVAVLLAIRDDRLVVVETAEPERRALPMAVHAAPGAAIPLHAGACGKIVHAFAPELSEAAAAEPPTDAELELVRDQRFALDDEEYLEGIRGVAAPVTDASGVLVALILVSGLSASLTLERLAGAGREAANAAGAISAAVGAPPLPDQREPSALEPS